jgi:transmembrane 9 superfamily protein 2/4
MPRWRAPSALALALAVACALAPRSSAFYLPGVAPQDYERDDLVTIKVRNLDSIKTQLPFDYYDLPYCRPPKIEHSAENLGEVLRGDRIENSPYTLEMRLDEQCKVVCTIDALNAEQAAAFQAKIEDEYRVNMILDNLPVAMVQMREKEDGTPVKTYERGFPVGFKAALEEGGEERFFLHNHVRFVVLYHRDVDTDLARIVGFECEPFSVRHEYEKPLSAEKPVLDTCNPGRMQYVSHGQTPQLADAGQEVVFTYDVLFKMSDIRWASRWDTYLLMLDDQIHWFSIVNSMMIVLFLTGMVALIMLRTLHRDISRYNQLETAEEAQEESGWKLVHGDVFRPPGNYDTLSHLVGTGFQLVAMLGVTLVFAVLGFLSPANRGGLMTAMVLLYVLAGVVNGYVTARLYKYFRGADWRGNTLRAAFTYPTVVFFVFCVLNSFIWGQRSSGAVPFGTFFVLIFLWFGVSVPLVFFGAYAGHAREAIEDPTRTNKIPRQVPEQPWYMRDVFAIMVGGVLPFGAVFIELFFILTSLWLHQFYYIFGFLALVFLILAATCAEITIVMCYFQLCAEDYHWWWRAFLTSASSAAYLFAYGAYYYATKLEVTNYVSGMMFFGYMFIVSYSFALITGALGFTACFMFVRTIYGSVKID